MKYTLHLMESQTAAKAKHMVQHTFNSGCPDYIVYDEKLWGIADEPDSGGNVKYVLKNETIAVIS